MFKIECGCFEIIEFMTLIDLPELKPPLLLATDGSTSAWFAQRLLYPVATLMAKTEDGQPALKILTVRPRSAGRTGQTAESTPTEAQTSDEAFDSAQRSAIQPLHDQIQADLPDQLSASLFVRLGRPIPEVLNCAQELKAGLIAVGCQGKEGAKELLIGSVSAAIARYAACPVLVARGLESSPHPSWAHVLLVVSGSEATRQAIALTRQLIPVGIQRVTVLCVQPPLNTHYLFGPFATPTPSWQLTQSLQEAQKEQSQQLVQQAEAALGAPGLAVETLVQVSEPGPLICQVAQQQQANIIIVGSDSSRKFAMASRAGALRSIRLSATGDYLIHHAPCPVLLCRSPRPEIPAKDFGTADVKQLIMRIPRRR